MLRVAEEFHGTHTGQQRRANEDALYARAPLFAVADGMGGAQAGELASRLAVETLAAGLDAGDRHQPVEQRLADLVHIANARIHERAQADDRAAGMGTTMTVVLVGADDVTIAHVGDSRAYLCRDGELTRLTRDHSLVEELVEQGRLTPEEASRHPQRSVITRSVGPESRVEVDTLTAAARDGDVFLLCSDGLTTMVDEGEIARILDESPSLAAAGRALIDAANEAGGRDNITVVLFRLEDVHRAAAGEAPTAAAEAPAGGPAPEPPTVEHPVARRLEPLPPAQAPRPRERPPRRWARRLLIVAGVIGFIGFPILFGGYVALRAVYFVGTDARGFVTVFRGLPYELPLGIDLYQENYVSPIPIEQVPAGRREAVVGQELRSQHDAYDLVRRLELGQLQGTR